MTAARLSIANIERLGGDERAAVAERRDIAAQVITAAQKDEAERLEFDTEQDFEDAIQTLAQALQDQATHLHHKFEDHAPETETEATAIETAIGQAIGDGLRTTDIAHDGKDTLGCCAITDAIIERLT